MDKLNDAHVLAMGKVYFILFFTIGLTESIAVGSGNKLGFYHDNESGGTFEQAKRIFLKAVCLFYLEIILWKRFVTLVLKINHPLSQINLHHQNQLSPQQQIFWG